MVRAIGTRQLEEHELWRLARAMVCGLYGVTGRGGFFRDACLRDRVRSSAVELLSTVAEGVGLEGAAPVLGEVRRRCVRLRSELVVAADQDYLADVELRAQVAQIDDLELAVRRATATPRGAAGQPVASDARRSPELL